MKQPRRASARERSLVLPVGVIARTVLVVLALALALALAASGVVGRAAGGITVADANQVAIQRAATERDLGQGYEQATAQVKKARALRLAISTQQADAIANKALTDLFTLRHSALVSLTQTLGSAADAAEASAKSTEQALDAKPGSAQASAPPVLLAPRLYAIVARFNDLATRLSEQATFDLTQSPTPAPSARPSATPSPTR